jgi:uncharacterized protein
MKILDKVAGDFDPVPDDRSLSRQAQDMIYDAFDDLSGNPCDYHVHLLGTGAGETGCAINPDFFSLKHPANLLKYKIFLNAAGVKNEDISDQQYLDRFAVLQEKFSYQLNFAFLALDNCYHEDGTLNTKDSSFYIPNEYMMEACAKFPEQAIPCISVHPYRLDAITELERWAKQGVRMVKWLPNSMGMDPMHPLCEPFYAKMKEFDMVLLSHAGEEDAVQVEKFTPLGNPLLLRKPLDMGLKVIVAHCASSGDNQDLDKVNKGSETNFNLFMRMMDEASYKNNLFGDISGITQINRCTKNLLTLLERQDLHSRLVNGSDYPLPAVNAAISLTLLVQLGYLEGEKQEPLHEIYKYNPLVFDYVLKRNMIHYKNKKWKFQHGVFEVNKKLGLKPYVQK